MSVAARTLYISGDWSYEKINNDTELQIAEYNGSDTDLLTESYFILLPITTIGSNVFNSNTTLKSITFDSNIEVVMSNAFTNASNLTSVLLTSSVKNINYSAFAGCSSLSSINLEDTNISIVSSSSFMNCDSLTEVVLPDTVITISDKAFSYCDGLTKITIPESVTTIHDKAFYKSPNVVIYCYKDSAAHVYAESKGIEYVLLEPVETYLLGDVDGDNQITIMDPTCLQLLLAHFIADEDGRMFIRSDIDHDGLNSIMDATCIQRYIAQFEDGTDIGKIYEY